MIDRPLSQLKKFLEKSEDFKLTGSDQLMYLHLWNKFNEAHYPETLRITDAELLKEMRLYDTNGKPSSIEVLRRGRQRLKARGLIECEIEKGYAPTYKLIKLYDEDELPIEEKAVGQKCISENSAGVLQAWKDNRGEPLKGGIAQEMIQLEKQYGTKMIVRAIVNAGKANDYGRYFKLYYRFFKAILAQEIVKGGEQNGKIVPISGKSKPAVEDWERERADRFFDD